MKITIETSDSDRVAMQPEMQSLLRQGATGIGSTTTMALEATDGGAPSEELLQSIGARADQQTIAKNTDLEDPYSSMVMAGGEPSLSRH